ncbi:dephospho-CoA kinase [Marinifilum caeruleilacunae]|uniref:Dephospho-CoA kinase n=1 Tax=Marinifilum caeruleilacunae TaxID=2499076 RepID=A0ABX1WSH9_9BACT|nr:dephospho-CoA kinase [Marinifilum caeruleilacunae]NOU58951.1 dephospho-CoA kinase [Marinifilum caeruleilacunae]
MIKIGLTGGIGTGKSIVAEVFKLIKIPVYVSDLEAKRLMVESDEIRSRLISRFGKEVYHENGALNRKFLADIIFNEPGALQDVNGIVHPVVRSDFQNWSERQQAPYVIQESAILFDTGLYKNFDKIICVTANEELRIQRVMDRDGVDRNAVMERMKNQLDEKIKIKKADYVIHNNTDLILPQIIRIHEQILALNK